MGFLYSFDVCLRVGVLLFLFMSPIWMTNSWGLMENWHFFFQKWRTASTSWKEQPVPACSESWGALFAPLVTVLSDCRLSAHFSQPAPRSSVHFWPPTPACLLVPHRCISIHHECSVAQPSYPGFLWCHQPLSFILLFRGGKQFPITSVIIQIQFFRPLCNRALY